MSELLVYPAGSGDACARAGVYLREHGVAVIDHPSPDITHVLLDAPAFGPDGMLRDGSDPRTLLRMLPPRVRVAGGGLDHPALANYDCRDFLKDPEYLARNAAITAQCTLTVAAPLLDTVISETPTLILGWGRIGKCLARLLTGLGAQVTVAARKEADRAMLRALGYNAVELAQLPPLLPRFRLICNTVPELLLTRADLLRCRACVKLDLASRRGLEGEDVVWARGLPGKYAPASSGRLMGRTFLRLCGEEWR